MQIQIECNQPPFQEQQCLLCSEMFEVREAKVILCNDEGAALGEVCPHCLNQGFEWMCHRFNQIQRLKQIDLARRSHGRKLPVGA